MNVFILYAHPEPEQSFHAALLATSVATLKAQGHTVRVSDLYAMNFNPVAAATDFDQRRFPERLQYDREQKFAASNGGLAADIQAEIEKVLWCDLLIVQFPLYWFSMPAIMKGWFDRVFVNGLIYGAGMRFDDGGLKGKKAMVCTSTGGFEHMFKSDGLMGHIDAVLWPIHQGVFGYSGLQSLPPFVAWAPVYGGQATCDKHLEDYQHHLQNIDNLSPLPMHPQSDFDDNYQMKAGVVPTTIGHKYQP